MAVIKIKEGTRDAFDDGWDRTYSLKLYKATTPTADSVLTDFTEATATSGYSAKSLAWGDASISWDAGLGKYKAVWADQTWSDVVGLVATGWYIADSTKAFAAEAKSLGSDYTELTISPTIILG